MRITEIRIKGLFDMFDHTIPLNQDEHLTVIYGINGIGKTMIFRILDCFYNGNFEDLVKLPFGRLVLVFENDNILECSKMDFKGETTLFLAMNEQNIHAPKKYERLDFKLSEQKVFQTIEKLPIHFINTERLGRNEGIKQQGDKISKITSNSIEYFSKRISQKIQTINSEYLKLSEQLELSLSKRLIQKQIRRDLTFDELVEIKNQVENHIRKLQVIGLMPSEMEVDFEFYQNIDEIERTLIAANLMDFQLKLTVFDDLYDKLKLFLEILNNRRLQYKTIAVSKENGFELINVKGQKLELNQLSTGEQHAIIMFYALLFEVPENALVLIDEPENSLHIAWQKAFLADMKDIIALRNFDILIATHSPSIIDGEWDLTVSLTGIEVEKHA
jgi:predicted ATP-binding protein involved in virulence